MVTEYQSGYDRAYNQGREDGFAMALKLVGALIKPGILPGDGWDKTAERNGIILAYNTLAAADRADGVTS